MLICCVQNTLLHGVEAYVLSPAQNDALDRAMAHYARKSMQGAAHFLDVSDGVETHRSMSTSEVLRYWRTAPAQLEMHAFRLKRIQQYAARPWKHAQFLTAVFGKYDFEQHDAVSINDNDPPPFANPWAKQMKEDILEG
eukprot:708364-Pyramimonas_sp.AAC.1